MSAPQEFGHAILQQTDLEEVGTPVQRAITA
jgi:hypothetical protein